MSSYSMSGPHTISIGDLNLNDINLDDWITLGGNELPNKKFTLNVHEAHGGHIVEVSTNANSLGDLYIISEDKDLGQEIGKIITHNILNAKHE